MEEEGASPSSSVVTVFSTQNRRQKAGSHSSRNVDCHRVSVVSSLSSCPRNRGWKSTDRSVPRLLRFSRRSRQLERRTLDLDFFSSRFRVVVSIPRSSLDSSSSSLPIVYPERFDFYRRSEPRRGKLEKAVWVIKEASKGGVEWGIGRLCPSLTCCHPVWGDTQRWIGLAKDSIGRWIMWKL